jgi:transcriptional accessory protein Tex/SPT6
VDTERKRISLSLRLTEETRSKAEGGDRPGNTGDRLTSVPKTKGKPPREARPKTAPAPANNAMAAAFAKLKR